MSKQSCQLKCLDRRLSAAVEHKARFQGQNRFSISSCYLPDVHSALPFAYFYSTVMFLADCRVWPQLGRVTRERGIKGTNTCDRLTQDEPWGHSKTAFDTEAHIFGVQPPGTHVTVTRALGHQPRKTDVFTSREERKMPKKLTTSATEQDYISLLKLGYTWPRGSVVQGFLEKKKALQVWMKCSTSHGCTQPLFYISKKL